MIELQLQSTGIARAIDPSRDEPDPKGQNKMTKKQMKQALQSYKVRKEAEHISEKLERMIVSNYPWSHNPYIPHSPVSDCFSCCIHEAKEIEG